MVTFDYDQSKMLGPPYSVPYTEVQTLFQSEFHITLLECSSNFQNEEERKRWESKGLDKMETNVILLEKRYK